MVMGGNPDAIEEQEANGQKELTQASQLPVKVNAPSGVDAILEYEKLGIKVIGKSDGDDLFFNVEIPNGWKIELTDHSMWTKLKDSEGNVKASIFYKAAFYDRDAFINLGGD